MSWNDPTEIHVYGDGQVYVAPVGTALPTTPTAGLNVAFVGLGYLTTDGVALSVTPSIQEIPAWQSRQPVRREMISQAVKATLTLMQFNETTIPFAFGGGSVTLVSAGIYRYDLPTNAALDERAMIIDTIDGGVHQRIILPRGNISDAVEMKFVKDAAAQLPIAFEALQPSDGSSALTFLSDDATTFAPGS